MSQTELPRVSWRTFTETVYQIASTRTQYSLSKQATLFLERLGLTTKEIHPKTTDYSEQLSDPRWWVRVLASIADTYDEQTRVNWVLTPTGKELYKALFVTRRYETAHQILQSVAANEPVITLFVHTFFGQDKVRLEQLRDLLRLERTEGADYDTNLHDFLELLEGFGIVECDKRWWTFRVLTDLPFVGQGLPSGQAFLLSPKTPFSNRQRIKDILAQLSGHIYWLDKHFRKEALAWLIDAIDGTRADRVTIVSGVDNVNRSALADYRDAVKELRHDGVVLEWKVIPKEQAHVLHDRWIWDETQAFNVPPVGSILANQFAEINPTTNRPNIPDLLAIAIPVLDYQPVSSEREV